MADETVGIAPIDNPERAVYIRGSSLQKFQDCSLSWFLSLRANGEESRGGALTFGSIVHAVADAINRGEVADNESAIESALDGVWDRVAAEGTWLKKQQQSEAIRCLKQYLSWRTKKLASSTHAGSEVDFDRTVALTDASGEVHQVRLKGQIDIVQVTSDDGIFIADLKTGSSSQTKEEATRNLQLGVYQTAVLRGLLEDAFPGDPRFAAGSATPAGAELVYIQQGSKSRGPIIREQAGIQESEDGVTFVEAVLAESAARLRAEDYRPQTGKACEFCSFKTSCSLVAEGKPVIA